MEGLDRFLPAPRQSGSGSGFGSGNGSGSGSGSGSGYGDGSGNGNGGVCGNGYGDGSGSGCGYAPILEHNGNRVWNIDGISTVITQIRGNVAKGYILSEGLTTKPCYVAKHGDHFAHGDTIREAVEDAGLKYFRSRDVEENIAEFKARFKPGKKYAGHEFYRWHWVLTGSCRAGRKLFIEEKGVCLDDEYTVQEFMNLCRDRYGWDIINRINGGGL